eukprot:NODE_8012_length_228_cov_18.631285_g7929_i0.p2 GENE.NODE_8012_length_228_cov_18.631285_g7929_i0~~NODE_8012_length_228_cov_18.631285_g7929_i0.p2  ORF type:complete len:53 (+),score=31.64 NODE_8012_length_228_cov_18.631285_g7929_i0:32-160(+)
MGDANHQMQCIAHGAPSPEEEEELQEDDAMEEAFQGLTLSPA